MRFIFLSLFDVQNHNSNPLNITNKNCTTLSLRTQSVLTRNKVKRCNIICLQHHLFANASLLWNFISALKIPQIKFTKLICYHNYCQDFAKYKRELCVIHLLIVKIWHSQLNSCPKWRLIGLAFLYYLCIILGFLKYACHCIAAWHLNNSSIVQNLEWTNVHARGFCLLP